LVPGLAAASPSGAGLPDNDPGGADFADGNPFGAGLSGRQSWRRAGAGRFGEVCAEAHEHDVKCQSATRLATPAADAPAPNGLPSATPGTKRIALRTHPAET